MVKLFLIGITIWIIPIAFAQNGTEVLPKGARSLGMGNASVTLGDAWSVFNNIGGLGLVENNQAFAGFDHRLGLQELTTLSAGLAFSSQEGNIGIGISNYGGELFNQQNLGVGYARQLGLASLGLKVNYFQTNIEGFGRSAAPILELGGVAELGPQLVFGAHIYNLSRAKLSKLTLEHLPMVVKTGLSYRPASYLLINLEAEKEVMLAPQFKAGMEYGIQEKLWARTGINTQPKNIFFGIGFRPKNFHVDYALSQHIQLGFTHHFSFNYLWNNP
ncbi:PorV/PorQ family protein [Pleomorphovibrio marinus]|uniref:hypothetical protein n=1 Tax=Pleomorphovibrio marinus TaxID=2164132 RepID=UPI000E0C56EA|nr:hypothetical protein [Pleomorphovibrio marinus]